MDATLVTMASTSSTLEALQRGYDSILIMRIDIKRPSFEAKLDFTPIDFQQREQAQIVLYTALYSIHSGWRMPPLWASDLVLLV